jgi:uncharacterized protein YlxW (UPF0749 family)
MKIVFYVVFAVAIVGGLLTFFLNTDEGDKIIGSFMNRIRVHQDSTLNDQQEDQRQQLREQVEDLRQKADDDRERLRDQQQQMKDRISAMQERMRR